MDTQKNSNAVAVLATCIISTTEHLTETMKEAFTMAHSPGQGLSWQKRYSGRSKRKLVTGHLLSGER